MIISDDKIGTRLDVFVSEYSGVSRSHAQLLIESALVSVCGKVQAKNYRLRQGDEVEVETANGIRVLKILDVTRR